MERFKCYKCKKYFDANDSYEYRGAFSCSEHFDEVVGMRDYQRKEIMREEDSKTKVFKGLDLSDSTIGSANRKILRGQIQIARKESGRLKEYENRDNGLKPKHIFIDEASGPDVTMITMPLKDFDELRENLSDAERSIDIAVKFMKDCGYDKAESFEPEFCCYNDLKNTLEKIRGEK